MKENTSKKLSKRLVQYGALSAAALGVADATGQVMYTDVDPDVVLNVGDTYDIDWNGQGASNFEVNNPSGLGGGNAAIVFPSSGGAFVGFTSGGFEYPNLLANGDTIDASSGYTADGVRGDLNYYGCAYSNSQWCGDVNDGYLGVKFLFNGNTHYGWARLDTDVNGDNLIVIKDFAYEATPDTAITAGDVGLGIGDASFQGFNYFVDTNNALNLTATSVIDNVAIYNVLGQQVINRAVNGTSAVIDLSAQQSGLYLVTVTIDGAQKTVKVVR